MKIGDLVVCDTVDGKPVGLVVERFNETDIFYVLISGINKSWPIRSTQLEVINESR